VLLSRDVFLSCELPTVFRLYFSFSLPAPHALSPPRQMGKAKKTRKYAAVKRLINPKDLKQ
jgi:hypothetical protein